MRPRSSFRSFSRRCGPLLALAAFAVGVPLVACGGRVLSEGDDDADSGSSTASSQPSGSSATSASASSSATATGSSSASSAASVGSGSVSAGGLGSTPCTAYTAAYNDCPPTASSTGCQYYDTGMPYGGVDPIQGQDVPAGCKLEIVPPTDPGGTTCAHVSCTCTDGAWQPSPGIESYGLCPQ